MTLIGIGLMLLAAVGLLFVLLLSRAKKKRLDTALREEYGEYGCDHLRR